MDLTQVLPEELLADVLRRVAPRGLAACRCACKALLGIINARRLLRTDLLPHSVAGIFINFHSEGLPEFFARPSTGPTISGRFDYLPPHIGDSQYRGKIEDHCNGLLLLEDYFENYYVVNPATRQWNSLPPHPSMSKSGEIDADFTYQEYLIFDPTVSPHYQFTKGVFVISNPTGKWKPEDFGYNRALDELDTVMEESEWPPSVCALHVFSSSSGRWEERSFIRDGKAADTIADMRRHFDKHYAVYCRGALYMHCITDFIMRFSLSNDKCQVIKPPIHGELGECPKLHLGQSEKGVYLASICEMSRLLVWVLDESCGQTNWVLKHNSCIPPILDYDRPILGPWVLQDINYEYLKERKDHTDTEDMKYLKEKKLQLNSSKEELVEEKIEWDSQNDNILHKEDVVDAHGNGYFDILGFHPYKEIVFLDVSMYRGLAYHFTTRTGL
ncbi:hypothetical protein VPH35_018736 [Triticum aestivum]